MSDDSCSRKGEMLAELGRKAEQRRIVTINFTIFVAEFGDDQVLR